MNSAYENEWETKLRVFGRSVVLIHREGLLVIQVSLRVSSVLKTAKHATKRSSVFMLQCVLQERINILYFILKWITR